jgi:hypothetical protein
VAPGAGARVRPDTVTKCQGANDVYLCGHIEGHYSYVSSMTLYSDCVTAGGKIHVHAEVASPSGGSTNTTSRYISAHSCLSDILWYPNRDVTPGNWEFRIWLKSDGHYYDIDEITLGVIGK